MVSITSETFHVTLRIDFCFSFSACAFTTGTDKDKKEAFDLARACFQTLLESNEIDESSLTNFFRAIYHHLKHGAIRDQLAEAVFLEGRRRGKIGKQVVVHFQKASPTVSDRVLSEHEIQHH